MLPSPPCVFFILCQKVLWWPSHKHVWNVNYLLASSTISRSADRWSAFRTSRCLWRETFTRVSLTQNNSFIMELTHTSGHPFPGSVPEMCVSVCVTLSLLGALAQSSSRCCLTCFPQLWINRTPVFTGRYESLWIWSVQMFTVFWSVVFLSGVHHLSAPPHVQRTF